MIKSIINNSRDIVRAISKIENELTCIFDDIRKIKSAKASITQPADNQLLTWDEDLSMVVNSLWQLPAADGAANEIIFTDGAGNLGWVAPGAAAVAGADTQVQYNAAGAMAAEAAFTYNYGTNTLTADNIRAVNNFAPSVANGATLGTAALEFADAYFADEAVLYFGNDQEVTLTHIQDTGLILNSNMQLQFRDAQIYIASLNDGHLDLEADTQIDLNSSVYLDVCADAGADVNAILVRDAGGFIDYRTSAELLADLSGDAGAAFSWNNQNLTNVGTLTAASVRVTADVSPNAADGATLGTAALEFSDLYLADGGVIYLGSDQEVTLTHIHNTGARINSTMQLQFRDSAIHIASLDDGHLDLTADIQIDLNSTVYTTGHVGICVAPSATYIPLYISKTVTANLGTVVGIQSLIHWNPSADSGGDFYGMNIATYPEGSSDMRDVYNGSWSFIAVNNSNDARNYLGFYVQATRNNSTMTFSGYASMFTIYGSAVAGAQIAVAGNGYGLWLRDYTNIFLCAGTIYGIKQEGSTHHNNFEGTIEIDSDANGLILGDGLDVKIYFDGSDLIINSLNITANDEIHFTNFDFYVFDNPLKITTIKSGATQVAAGAAANEVWKTSGHASLPDNVMVMGV